MQEGIGSGSDVGVGPAKEKLQVQYRGCYADFQALWLLLEYLVRRTLVSHARLEVPSISCQKYGSRVHQFGYAIAAKYSTLVLPTRHRCYQRPSRGKCQWLIQYILVLWVGPAHLRLLSISKRPHPTRAVTVAVVGGQSARES
jgi:hypothetical protein